MAGWSTLRHCPALSDLPAAISWKICCMHAPCLVVHCSLLAAFSAQRKPAIKPFCSYCIHLRAKTSAVLPASDEIQAT